MSERNYPAEAKKWENGITKWDLTEASMKVNPLITSRHGRDAFSYTPETTAIQNYYLRRWEGPLAHGYPYTSWLQMSLIYACGIYTATNQGILKRGQIFKNFWGHHYFDWIMFARRSAIFGVAGGLIAGTLLFGDLDMSLRRIKGKLAYHLKDRIPDVRNSNAQLIAKINN